MRHVHTFEKDPRIEIWFNDLSDDDEFYDYVMQNWYPDDEDTNNDSKRHSPKVCYIVAIASHNIVH